ncbi:unnamed protein product [Periconia digitata]|uniref:Uncharacterized protein n=1 Tax=Periconia digitata TaxID=1303443 RepID=A0A9W4UQ85_9PLEO|nr:unnamed protein product [Periconia digitata]
MPSITVQSSPPGSPPPTPAPEDDLTPPEQHTPVQSSEWMPTLHYQAVCIGSLQPGPQHITLKGRVVNAHDIPKPSKRPQTAQGYVKIIIADDTGAMTVRLWYAHVDWAVKLRLGMLVSIWTVHVSHGNSESVGLAPKAAPLFTSMFPEGEKHCHFMMHDGSEKNTMLKRPFKAGPLAVPGLMTLKQYLDGGFHVDECKVMVCVKYIGARTECKSCGQFYSFVWRNQHEHIVIKNNGATSELITIGILDDTAQASLTLYGFLSSSATTWTPSHTVLLLASPRCRIGRGARLSLGTDTQLYIDPDMPDARLVRALSQRLSKREHAIPPFPPQMETTETAAIKILFKLSEIDEIARSNPPDNIMGYISVVLTGVHLVANCQRNMLMGTECCGIPLFANSAHERCRHCETVKALRINPHILGNIIDETGQIESGKLILSNTAWEQLLGRTADQLVSASLDVLAYLEARLMFLRLTFGFGLDLGDVGIGRLAVWCVKM